MGKRKEADEAAAQTELIKVSLIITCDGAIDRPLSIFHIQLKGHDSFQLFALLHFSSK